MNIYLLERIMSPDGWVPKGERYWDTYAGHIIAANSDYDARRLADRKPGDEGHIWQTDKVSCRIVGTTDQYEDAVATIILSDFRAG